MNRMMITFFMGVLFAVGLVYSPCHAESVEMSAMAALRSEVAKALPADRKLTRVAVLDFRGDEGNMVRNAVTSAINGKTSWKVMERVDFSIVLAEQGLQLKDIMDDRTRVRHGKLKGVQGLVTGDVYGIEDGFMSCAVRAHVKLVDVEKGEVLFAKDFEARAVSPFRPYVFGGAGALALLMVLSLFFSLRARRRRALSRVAGVPDAAHDREGMEQGLDAIMVNVAEAKSRLVETGKTSDAVELKDIERDLMEMKRSLARGTGRMSFLDRQVLWKLEDLENLSYRIRSMASSSAAGGVGREIDALKTGLGGIGEDLRERSPRYL